MAGGRAQCTVELARDDVWSCGVVVEDARPAVAGYKDTKRDEMLESTQLVLRHLGFDSQKRGITIRLGGDLCCVSGIGASAANCVALARALADALGQPLTDEQINAAAYEGEKGYHGTPSGIDNTASTYGGVLRFQRTAAGPPKFEPRVLAQPVRIVYASTGITASTTAVVGDVRKRRDEDPAWYAALEKRYEAIFAKADAALNACDAAALGAVANENHTLLQDLGVSCKGACATEHQWAGETHRRNGAELDDLVDAARAAGALGAKMSGTGRGGLMWAVVADEASQNKVRDALSKLSSEVWTTEFK